MSDSALSMDGDVQACDHPFLVLGRSRADKDFEHEIKRFMAQFTAHSNSM